MHRRTVGFLAAVSLIGAVPATGAAVASPGSPSAHAACTYHRIVGKRKCIAAGQYCIHTRRANRDYHKYGLHCGKRDRRGSYHLVYR
jgi:hypothetical protein